MFRNVCKLLHKVQNQLLVRNYLQLRINSLQQDSVQTARAARDHHKKIWLLPPNHLLYVKIIQFLHNEHMFLFFCILNIVTR